MEIIKITAGNFAVNCYIVYSSDSKEGIIVDPGGDASRILKAIKDNEINIKSIVLTHGHGDHIGAVAELKNFLKVPVLVHEHDLIMIQDADRNLSSIMSIGSIEINADGILKDGDTIDIGDQKMEVIHTPGHTPGCISLKIGNYLLSGDTLFKGTIGRTDLLDGDFDQIIKSIKERLLVLDDITVVLPGHGDSTTILYEKMYNSFLS